MKRIIAYDNFLNENQDTVLTEIESLFFLPLEERKKLEVELKKLGYANESVREGFLSNIINKLHNWLSDKALKYLINNKARMLPKMLEGLKVLDPTDLSGLKPIKAMYLGGGIDFAFDFGGGWREEVEELFGLDHVVTGEDVYALGSSKKIDTDKYNKPMILNPLNIEPNRSDPNTAFAQMFTKWKEGQLNKAKSDDTLDKNWAEWVKTINKEIKIPDLHILRFCDANLVKYDSVAGDGTKGELQLSDWAGQQIFLWLGQKTVEGDMFEVKNVSPWSLPLATKILRGDDEAWLFLEALKNKFST